MIYAAATYTLLLMLYSANNLPYSALSGVITGDMKERNSISSYRFVAVMFAQFFVQVFMLPIILSAGNGDKAVGIESVMTWLAIIGSVMLLITFFTTKERVIPKPEQESSLKADLKDLFQNKPWVITLCVTTLIFITLAMKGGSYVYYFNNYVDETALANFISPITSFFNSVGMNFFGEDPRSAGFGLFNAGGIIMMIVGITFSKRFADRFGKRDVFMTSLFIATVFVFVFIFYPPKAVGMMFLSQVLHGFFYGIGTPLLWAMIADVADYSEWKNNRRATAIIFSAMMVGLKVGLSIGSSLVALIIGKYGYISTEGTQDVIQPETVSAGAKMLVSIFPSIPFFLACGLLFFYKIDKKLEVQIEHDLAERRKK